MRRSLGVVCRAYRAGATLFAASVFALMMLYLAPAARADIFTSPLDLKASVYEQAWQLIPQPFRPSEDDVLVKSATQDDFAVVQRRSYPDEPVDELDGLYLPRAADCPPTPHLPPLATILIDRSLSREQAERTLVHEWGHHIFTHLLTDDERTNFGNEWEVEGILKLLPTEYAYRNENEGFAECFATYVFHPEQLTTSALHLFDALRRSLATRLSPDALSYVDPKPSPSLPPVDIMVPLLPLFGSGSWLGVTTPTTPTAPKN